MAESLRRGGRTVGINIWNEQYDYCRAMGISIGELTRSAIDAHMAVPRSKARDELLSVDARAALAGLEAKRSVKERLQAKRDREVNLAIDDLRAQMHTKGGEFRVRRSRTQAEWVALMKERTPALVSLKVADILERILSRDGEW